VFISGSGGYTGSPTFDVTGLPTGVVPSFTPPTSRVGTTMRLTANASLPRGTFPIQVRAVDGDKVRVANGIITTSFVGPFTLSAALEPFQAPPGGSTTLKVSIGPAAGSAVVPDVELSFLGLPNGTTITSSGQRTTTSATFTVSFASTVVQADYNIQVRGQSGSVVQSVPVLLRISAKPNASLAATAISTNKGGTAQTEIIFTPIAGIGNPAFVIEGVIPGATNTVFIGSDKRAFIQIITTSTTPAGTYPMTFKAINSLATTTIPFTVTVS
jgi:hypothetical protein